MATFGLSLFPLVLVLCYVLVLALGQRLAGQPLLGSATAPAPTELDDPDWGDQLRASDHDREQAVAILQAAITSGRLTLNEYDHRVQTVYASQTLGELRHQLADLPHRINHP